VASPAGEFLLEVGFEEMPAPWLPGLGDQLGRRFAEAAGREFLAPRDVQVFHTPRRLVLGAQVLVQQADRSEEVWGPAGKIAKDSSGSWTKAAEGFAKKNGTTVDHLEIVLRGTRGIGGGMPAAALTEPSEEYVRFIRPVVGRTSIAVLPSVVSECLRALAFPKRMTWDAWLEDGKGAFPFGRPIRWLILMLDGTVIPFVIYEMVAGGKGKARVASGPATLGHRFLPRGSAGKPQTVRSLQELRKTLRANFVLLDPTERSARIDQGLANRATNMLVPDVGKLNL
jgi:glycyl-tRNA synthetase beta chain